VYALRFLTGCWKPWLGRFWGFDLHAEAGRLQLERPALNAWLQVALEDNDDLVRAVFAYGFEHAAVVFAVDSGNYDGAGVEVEFEDWLTGRAVGWYEIRGELVGLQGQRDFEATYLDLGFLAHGPFSITTRDRVLNSTRCNRDSASEPPIGEQNTFSRAQPTGNPENYGLSFFLKVAFPKFPTG
jgi:hypothetical protein